MPCMWHTGCGHLFKCLNTALANLRREQIKSILRTRTNIHISSSYPSPITTPSPTPSSTTRSPQKLWVAQERERMGLENFAKGWVSKEWAKVAETYGSKDPTGDVAKLITLLWDGWCETIWELRNNILKHQPTPTQHVEEKTIKERLKWYRKYKMTALPERFQFLTEYSDDELRYWSRKNSRAQLKHLDTVRKIHEIECTQRSIGQTVITDWLNNIE